MVLNAGLAGPRSLHFLFVLSLLGFGLRGGCDDGHGHQHSSSSLSVSSLSSSHGN